MVKSRRVFTREFKLAAVKELESGKPLGYVARQLEVSPNTLHRWRREFREQPTTAFSVRAAVSLSPEKRPCVVTSKPAIERRPGRVVFTLSLAVCPFLFH